LTSRSLEEEAQKLINNVTLEQIKVEYRASVTFLRPR